MFLSHVIRRCGAFHHSQFLGSISHTFEINGFVNTKIKGFKSAMSLGKSKPVKTLSKHNDDPEIPPYVEVDPHNSRMIQMLTNAKSRNKRYANMVVMLEGKRLIEEALVADLEPLLILFSRKTLLRGLPFDEKHIQPESTIIHFLPYRHIKTWSSLTTAPGIIGLFRMPNLEYNVPVNTPLPVTFVCDNIREPGNLGSILRVAAALPVEKVILLSGCVDLWEPKVTRGSCGAMFHLNVMTNASWDDVEDKCTGNVILADHEVFNNEPLEEDDCVAVAEDYDDDSEYISYDTDDTEIKRNDLRKKYQIPLKAYYDIAFSKQQSYVIVIGGETEGLSEKSFDYAKTNNGTRVNIPLDDSVGSLNSATAIGIISFEIKRQLSLRS